MFRDIKTLENKFQKIQKLKHKLFAINNVRTRFESLVQKMDGLRFKKVQNNEFVESGLENWALVNQTTNKVDLDDKRIKIDKFKLKKIVLNTIRGDQLLYIDPQV